MKTSKIILIIFFGIVGLFLLSLLIQSGHKRDTLRYTKEARVLPPFNHLRLTGVHRVQVEQADNDSIFVSHDIKSEAIMPDFHLEGDTLVISWKEDEHNWNHTLTCSNLKSISLQNSRVDLNHLKMDTLFLTAYSSEIYINNGDSLNCMVVNLQAKSNLRCEFDEVKSLHIEANSSMVELNIKLIDQLQVEAKDTSEISVWKVLHTHVNVDESSRYYSR